MISPGTNVTCVALSMSTPQDNSWEGVLGLTQLLQDKGWYTSPPANSMLLREPACAWLTAGKTGIDQRHKTLPCLHKDIARKAIHKWIEFHFYPPCAGLVPGDDTRQLNLMEHFCAFFWAYYTLHHKPCIPALTDVGRFIFTYMWQKQHSLMR